MHYLYPLLPWWLPLLAGFFYEKYQLWSGVEIVEPEGHELDDRRLEFAPLTDVGQMHPSQQPPVGGPPPGAPMVPPPQFGPQKFPERTTGTSPPALDEPGPTGEPNAVGPAAGPPAGNEGQDQQWTKGWEPVVPPNQEHLGPAGAASFNATTGGCTPWLAGHDCSSIGMKWETLGPYQGDALCTALCEAQARRSGYLCCFLSMETGCWAKLGGHGSQMPSPTQKGKSSSCFAPMGHAHHRRDDFNSPRNLFFTSLCDSLIAIAYFYRITMHRTRPPENPTQIPPDRRMDNDFRFPLYTACEDTDAIFCSVCCWQERIADTYHGAGVMEYAYCFAVLMGSNILAGLISWVVQGHHHHDGSQVRHDVVGARQHSEYYTLGHTVYQALVALFMALTLGRWRRSLRTSLGGSPGDCVMDMFVWFSCTFFCCFWFVPIVQETREFEAVSGEKVKLSSCGLQSVRFDRLVGDPSQVAPQDLSQQDRRDGRRSGGGVGGGPAFTGQANRLEQDSGAARGGASTNPQNVEEDAVE